MSDNVSINKLLRDATAAVVSNAVRAQRQGDTAAKVASDIRSNYLRRLTARFRSMADPTNRAVFVSYTATGQGNLYFDLLRRSLQDSQFDVVTGFQQAEGDRRNVLARVRTQLARCHVYVAIFTRELKVVAPSGEAKWAPSVWTVEEKGMALGLGKPFILMIEEGIHEDFWRKTTPERVHFMFNGSTIVDVVKTVVDAVAEEYIELALHSATASL